MSSNSGPATAIMAASPDDVTAMMPLIREHAQFEHSTATGTLEALQAALTGSPPELHGWIAINSADQVVGYATATTDYSTWEARAFMHLDCLFVSEAARGSGIGAQLLDTVRRFAKQQGMAELQWQTPDWNVSAVRFYLRQGACMSAKCRFRLDL